MISSQYGICIYIHASNTVVADNMHDMRFELNDVLCRFLNRIQTAVLETMVPK